MMKSIEQLEQDIWERPSKFETGLIERCYNYRKIPIDKLSNEQLRTLTAQSIGLKFTIDLILKKLDEDVLCEGDFYPGDLLEATLKISNDYWTIAKALKLSQIINRNLSLLVSGLGKSKTKKIERSVNELIDTFAK